MNRFALPLVVFAVLAALLGYAINHATNKEFIPSPLIGKPAPVFSLPSLTDPGRTVSSQELRGRWYVINVWGTWCVGCRAEHAMLLEAKKENRVPIIGLNWKDDDGAALKWLAELGNPYDVVLADHDGRAAIDWGVYLAPESFLVNDKGIVVHKQAGPMTREVWNRDFVPRLGGRTTASR
jgi:cytochrome c biogenesis protein CcmG/thiol:disulfide interchange protein DsbE